MNNTINVNYMTRTYSNFLKNNEAKGGKAESPSFCDRVAEKSTSATETGKAGTVSAKDMTMDEYKQYIHEKISTCAVAIWLGAAIKQQKYNSHILPSAL